MLNKIFKLSDSFIKPFEGFSFFCLQRNQKNNFIKCNRDGSKPYLINESAFNTRSH